MSDDDPIARRGTAGILLLAVPIVTIVLVAVGYAVVFSRGMAGREASGPLVRVAFRGCAEAAVVVRRRADAMGLPELREEPEADGFALVLRLPDRERSQDTLPAALARPGTLVVRAGEDGEVLATEAEIERSSVEMAFLDAPHAQVMLRADAAERLFRHQQAHMDDTVTVWVDGERLQAFRNLPALEGGELDLDKPSASDRERIDFAAFTAVALEHGPLPCPVEPVSVTPVER